MTVDTCNLSTQEVQAGGSKVRGYPEKLEGRQMGKEGGGKRRQERRERRERRELMLNPALLDSRIQSSFSQPSCSF